MIQKIIQQKAQYIHLGKCTIFKQQMNTYFKYTKSIAIVDTTSIAINQLEPMFATDKLVAN